MVGCARQNAKACWSTSGLGSLHDVSPTLLASNRPARESLDGRPCHHGHNCDVFLASYDKRDRNGDLLNPSAMPPPSLDEVANLSLSVGKLFLETGASARTVHEAVEEISRGFGCQKAEAYCQHAAIIVMLRRGAESCVQMGKVGEHGVNLRRAEALSRIVSHIALGEIDCPQAQREVDNVPRTAPGYPVWFVCLATGIACAAFGRLLHAAWLSFVPTLVGAAAGQWLRHCLLGRKQNVFLVAGIVSFVSAFLAGLGGRLLGSGHLEIATMAAVLLLVPGVAVLNAQLDAIDGKPNLAAARGLRIAYLLLFMTLGLVVAQHLVAAVPS